MSRPVKKKMRQKMRRKIKDAMIRKSYRENALKYAKLRDIAGIIAIFEAFVIVGLILAGWVI